MNKKAVAVGAVAIGGTIAAAIAILKLKKSDSGYIPVTCSEGYHWNGALCVPDEPPVQEYPGCTDPESVNFNPLATVDDGSCGVLCNAGWKYGGGKCVPDELVAAKLKVVCTFVGQSDPREVTLNLRGAWSDVTLTTVDHMATFEVFAGEYNLHLIRPDLGDFEQWVWRGFVNGPTVIESEILPGILPGDTVLICPAGQELENDACVLTIAIPPEVTLVNLRVSVGELFGEPELDGVTIDLLKEGGLPEDIISYTGSEMTITNLWAGNYMLRLQKAGYTEMRELFALPLPEDAQPVRVQYLNTLRQPVDSAVADLLLQEYAQQVQVITPLTQAGADSLWFDGSWAKLIEIHRSMTKVNLCDPGYHIGPETGVCETCVDGTKWDGFNCWPEPCATGSHWEDVAQDCVPDYDPTQTGTLTIHVQQDTNGASVGGALITLRKGFWNTLTGTGYWDYTYLPPLYLDSGMAANGILSKPQTFGMYEVVIKKAGYEEKSMKFGHNTALTNVIIELTISDMALCLPYMSGTTVFLQYYDQIAQKIVDTNPYSPRSLTSIGQYLNTLLALGKITQAQLDSALTTMGGLTPWCSGVAGWVTGTEHCDGDNVVQDKLETNCKYAVSALLQENAAVCTNGCAGDIDCLPDPHWDGTGDVAVIEACLNGACVPQNSNIYGWGFWVKAVDTSYVPRAGVTVTIGDPLVSYTATARANEYGYAFFRKAPSKYCNNYTPGTDYKKPLSANAVTIVRVS